MPISYGQKNWKSLGWKAKSNKKGENKMDLRSPETIDIKGFLASGTIEWE